MGILEVTPKKFGVKEEMLLFSEDNLEEILKTLGLSIGENGIIYDSENHIAKCSMCEKTLTKDNIGAFFPGSVEAICDEFSCFVAEMAKVRTKIRETP